MPLNRYWMPPFDYVYFFVDYFFGRDTVPMRRSDRWSQHGTIACFACSPLQMWRVDAEVQQVREDGYQILPALPLQRRLQCQRCGEFTLNFRVHW